MLLAEKYNEYLIEFLVDEYGFTKERANTILSAIALYIVNALVFKKSINTPFGTMVMTKDGISITGQNIALIELLKKDFSDKELATMIENIIKG